MAHIQNHVASWLFFGDSGAQSFLTPILVKYWKMFCHQEVCPLKILYSQLTCLWKQACLAREWSLWVFLHFESWWVCLSLDSLKSFLVTLACLWPGNIQWLLFKLRYQCKLCDGRDCLITSVAPMSKIVWWGVYK